MVAEERDEILGRKVQHPVGWRGPDRGAHRRQIIAQQARREVAPRKIFAQCEASEFAGRVVLDALRIERQDVAQHPQIGRRQQILRLGEQALRGIAPGVAAAFPFETAGIGRDREAHAAFHGFDAEMGKQRRQVGIIQLVVDDEADVDRERLAVIVDGDGVAVAAGPEFAIVDRDRISLRQGPGCGVAGDSRSDNCDPHSKAPVVR